MVRVAVLAGVLALVVAGGSGFLAGRMTADSSFLLLRCASAGMPGCNQGVDVDAVVAALVESGFDCSQDSSRASPEEQTRELATCELASDATAADTYEVWLHSLDGMVWRFQAFVTYRRGLPLTPQREAFLSWVTTLPFASEPDSAEAAQAWLQDQLAIPASGTTTIGGYDYELSYPWVVADKIRLEVDGSSGWWSW